MKQTKDVRPLVYRKRYNSNQDTVYEFCFESSKQKDEYNDLQRYSVEITIDELNDSLVVKKSCECKDKCVFRPNQDCKHIKSALSLLRLNGIHFRESCSVV